MNASVAGLAAEPFRDEGDLLVYVAPHAPTPAQDASWFFDEIAKRRQHRLLVDLRDSGAVTQGIRTVVYKRHHELDGRRIAVLGNSRFQEFVVSFLLAATGHPDVRYFHDEASARAWVREERHGGG